MNWTLCISMGKTTFRFATCLIVKHIAIPNVDIVLCWLNCDSLGSVVVGRYFVYDGAGQRVSEPKRQIQWWGLFCLKMSRRRGGRGRFVLICFRCNVCNSAVCTVRTLRYPCYEVMPVNRNSFITQYHIYNRYNMRVHLQQRLLQPEIINETHLRSLYLYRIVYKCFRLCLTKLDRTVNDFPQSSHVWGLSPECVSLWRTK